MKKVLRMMRGYHSFVMDNPAYFGFIAFLESPFPTTNVGVVHETTSAIYELCQRIIQQGMADGSLRTDQQPDLLANNLWASSYGIMQFIVSKGAHLAEQRQIDSEQLFETYLAYLENGLRNHS